MLRIISWNLNGIRAVPHFLEWLNAEQPDLLCLQEVRAASHEVALDVRHPPGYHVNWYAAEQKGYSGVAVYSRHAPKAVHMGMGLGRYDGEGRVLAVEFDAFVLISVYVPSGAPERSKWFYKMSFLYHLLDYVAALRAEEKSVILCGDFNIAHTELDLVRPIRVAGFTAEERDWISELLVMGFVDSFRYLHPNQAGAYTWWSNRAGLRERNHGWRLDYCFLSADVADKLLDASIHTGVRGSDHCPVSVTLDMDGLV